MVEKGIRGGKTQVSLKRVKANSKSMKSYDKDKPSTYLLDVDANNLYGLAMSKLWPYADFNWCEIDIEKFSNYDDKSEIGYFLDVDLEYPKETHDAHIDYPLAPELIKVKGDMLSCRSKELHEKYVTS